jgi:hypothetical protein
MREDKLSALTDHMPDLEATLSFYSYMLYAFWTGEKEKGQGKGRGLRGVLTN